MKFDRASYLNQPLEIEPELRKLFNLEETLTIFEIGACEGEDSIKYAKLFKKATVYAFEPLPENIALIKGNLSREKVNNVKFFNKALSNQTGISEFHVSEGRPANAAHSDWDYGNKSSSLLPPEKHLEIVDFIHFDKKISVDTITIESFCKENGILNIDFIHMDVQGAELMVLAGAGVYVKCIKAIWLEVSKVDLYKGQPLANDVQKFMHANNFVLVKDSLVELQGDQLYVSRTFFPDAEALFPPGSTFIKGLKRAVRSLRRITARIFGG